MASWAPQLGSAVWGWGFGLAVALSAPRQGMGGGAVEQVYATHEAGHVFDLQSSDFATGDDLPHEESLSFPGPVSQAFYLDDARICGIQGPVGGGKTTTLLYKALRRARMMPRSVIDGRRHYKLVAVRHTYRQLWTTTIPSYLKVFSRELGDWSGGRGNPVTHTIIFNDDYGEIVFTVEFLAFGDDVVNSMRGIECTDMWLSEADTMPSEVVTNGITRVNRWPDKKHWVGYPIALQSYSQIMCDFNAPEDEDNYTYRVFHDAEERKKVEREINRQMPEGAEPIRITFHNQPGAREPGAENLHNLKPGYYEAQVALMKLEGRGDQIARLVDNKITPQKVGDPVFRREWNRAIHVAGADFAPDPARSLLIGLDQGLLGAAVIAQFEPPMHWSIFAEMMFPSERLLAREFGARLSDLLDELFPGFHVEGAWADMAGEHGSSTSADENDTWNRLVAKTAGIRVRPQRIGTNRIQPRLEAVRAPLEYIHAGKPGFQVHPRCKYLIRGMEARYVWTEEINRRGDKVKVPEKQYVEANVLDATQYLLLSKVRGDGTSPGSFTRPVISAPRGAPPAKLPDPYRHDILNPYGGQHDW